MDRKTVEARVFASLIILVLSGLVGKSITFSKELGKVQEKVFFREISLTPLRLTYGTGKTGSVAYEIIVPKPNLGIEGKILLTSPQKLDDWEWQILFFGYAITVKKYMKPVGPTGVWFGGTIGMLPIVIKGYGEEGTHLYFILSGNIGYKWLLPGNFTLEPSLELNYYIGSAKLGAEAFPLGGLRPVLALSLGYAFS